MKIVIVNSNKIHQPIIQRCLSEWSCILIDQMDQLNAAKLESINPDYVFFLHWSFIIPREIHSRFNCILFHMTDLPFGRGGSPLQNLIYRGFEETMLSAIKVSDGIDTGPVFLKRRLCLYGTADEIFLRAGELMLSMMKEIMEKKITPIEQKGEIVVFKRRTREEGDISELVTIKQVYDHIRMLDGVGYPNAFLETSMFRLEFSRASIKEDGIICDVKIMLK